MQIQVIKKIVETYSYEQLAAAEAALLDEQEPVIDIEGKDEGEQLTHVLAAMQILKEMEINKVPLASALRSYTQRVRNSIQL
jgi:hypothetical protein